MPGFVRPEPPGFLQGVRGVDLRCVVVPQREEFSDQLFGGLVGQDLPHRPACHPGTEEEE